MFRETAAGSGNLAAKSGSRGASPATFHQFPLCFRAARLKRGKKLPLHAEQTRTFDDKHERPLAVNQTQARRRAGGVA
jgi:hypothetical protein